MVAARVRAVDRRVGSDAGGEPGCTLRLRRAGLPRAFALAALAVAPLLAPACRRAARPLELTLSLPYDLDSLEPGRRDRLSDFAVLSNVYETLVTTDANLALRPCLAERWTNPDETTWVFDVRHGVRFHDGRPLTARDVVFSFRRLLDDPGRLEAARHIRAIESVRGLAADRVEIRTRTPMADFLNRIRFIHVVPEGSTTEGLRSGAVGTGPYRLVSSLPGESVTLERFPGYWGAAPAVERAVVLLVRPPVDSLADLLAGRSGFVQSSSKDALLAGSQPGFAVRKASSIAVKLLYFDVTSPRTADVTGGVNPFRDRRVREAIHVGLDRARLVERLPAPALPAWQLVPPFIFGYAPRLPRPVADPARARALLAEAGFPSGFSTTVHARQLLADAFEPLRRGLAEIGIRADVRGLSEAEFFAESRDAPGFAVALSRFGCPTGDAANFLDVGLHSRSPDPRWGRDNRGGYADPEVDQLVEQAAITLQPGMRRPLLERVMEIAMRDLPWIPLYVDEDVYVFRDDLEWQPRVDNYVIVSEIRRR